MRGGDGHPELPRVSDATTPADVKVDITENLAGLLGEEQDFAIVGERAADPCPDVGLGLLILVGLPQEAVILMDIASNDLEQRRRVPRDRAAERDRGAILQLMNFGRKKHLVRRLLHNRKFNRSGAIVDWRGFLISKRHHNRMAE